MTYSFEKDAYPFQKERAAQAKEAIRFIFGSDKGTGKTMQAIKACEDEKRVWVACRGYNAQRSFLREVEKWEVQNKVALVVTSPSDLWKLTPETKWIITTHSALRARMEKKKFIGMDTKVGQFMWKYPVNALIVDEAHWFCNRQSKLGIGLQKVAKRIRRYHPLTGSFFMNRVTSLWNLLHTTDPKKWPGFWKFAIKHADAHPGAYGWEMNDFATDPKALQKEIEGVFARDTLEGLEIEVVPVFDLLEASVKQQEFGRKIAEDVMVECGDRVILTASQLTKLTRLRQLSVSPRLIGIDEYGPKIESVYDTLEDSDFKWIVFCQFSQGLEVAAEYLKKQQVDFHILTGAIKNNQKRESILQDFKDSKLSRCLLLSIGIGGESLTITEAKGVIRLDRWYNPEVDDQALRRIRRIGQDRPVIDCDKHIEGVDDFVRAIAEGKVQWAREILNKKWGRIGGTDEV